MSRSTFYPRAILELPQVDLPFKDATAYLMQGVVTQSVFFELPAGAEVPAHSHCAQWGVVLDGRIELTIGGEKKSYSRGDSYFIPAGVVHQAEVPKDAKVLDVFFAADRYRPKI